MLINANRCPVRDFTGAAMLAPNQDDQCSRQLTEILIRRNPANRFADAGRWEETVEKLPIERRREELQSAEPFGEAFSFARTVHTLGSALQQTAKQTADARTWLVERGSPLTRRRMNGSIVMGWGTRWTRGMDYTGVTRLAKNILQNVVGRYLDRDRQAMSALDRLPGLALRMAEAMGARIFSNSAR